MEIHTAIEMIRKNLRDLYPPEEIESFIALIFEHLLNLSRVKLHLKRVEVFPEAKLIELNKILERLQQFEPIQYIFGETEFYGLKFKVNPSVLIPRPETEELVDWILKDNPPANAALMDIGTGSGCIPVSIAKNRPDLHITACDISPAAIHTASENAGFNKVPITFLTLDILNWSTHPLNNKFDIIVSNPPYVTRSEESLMLKNVTAHEPHLALFVPDEDALLFYKAIAAFAKEYLKPDGKLYFEINENLGSQAENLLKKYYSNITIKKDIHGKERMIRVN